MGAILLVTLGDKSEHPEAVRPVPLDSAESTSPSVNGVRLPVELPLRETATEEPEDEVNEDSLSADPPSETLHDPGADLGRTMALRVEMAKQLRNVSEGAFQGHWETGNFKIVDAISWSTLRDSSGHPLPNEIRFAADGRVQVVTLSAAESPEAFELIGTVAQLDMQIQALKEDL